jgi:hypothetical protein
MPEMDKALSGELLKTHKMINQQIENAKTEASRMGIPPEMLRDSYGAWVLNPLLVAKAQTLHALAMLNPPKMK